MAKLLDPTLGSEVTWNGTPTLEDLARTFHKFLIKENLF